MISGLAFYSAVAALAAAGFLALGAPLHKQPSPRIDDWRRTANGWERQEQWPISTHIAVSQLRASPGPRTPMNTHPAVLALGQLVGVFAVLGVFSPLRSRQSRGWAAAVGRSFRASAFGS
jgi:hypothetical protein